MKKLILYVMLVCSSFLVVGCGCSNLTNSPKELETIDESKLSGKFFPEQMLETMRIKNFNIVVEDGTSTISFDIENTTETPVSIEYVKMSIFNNNSILLLESYGYVGGTLAGSETKHIVVDVDIDLSAATSITYERA